MKRVLLLTDSLGCPREEISVEKTWTDQLLQKYQTNSDLYFYTYCKHGLSTSFIDFDYIKEIEPDLIICQIGIVDACRRAFPRLFVRVISLIPILSKITNLIGKKYHKNLTFLWNIHYADKKVFNKSLEKICDLSKKTILIAIAPPGNYLLKNTYNIAVDVNEYNEIISNIADKNENIFFLNPYLQEKDMEKVLLSDGHHLNEYGNISLFNMVSDLIEAIM